MLVQNAHRRQGKEGRAENAVIVRERKVEVAASVGSVCRRDWKHDVGGGIGFSDDQRGWGMVIGDKGSGSRLRWYALWCLRLLELTGASV